MRKERYLLVRAPYDKRVASLEPLGLEYIMAAIKAEDAFCMIHDESISSPCFRFKRLLKVVDENKITIVGFSIISNIAHYVLKELHKLKKARPELKIMVGGAEVFINPDDFMLEDVDFVLYDHGLDSIRLAVRNEFAGEALKDCTGMAYRDGDTWVKNEKGEPISDYGILPDRSHFYDNIKKYRVLASREAKKLWDDFDQKLLVFAKGDTILAFNLDPNRSQSDFFIPVGAVGAGDWELVFDTDRPEFGGYGRIAPGQKYIPLTEKGKGLGIRVYLPARSAIALRRKKG